MNPISIGIVDLCPLFAGVLDALASTHVIDVDPVRCDGFICTAGRTLYSHCGDSLSTWQRGYISFFFYFSFYHPSKTNNIMCADPLQGECVTFWLISIGAVGCPGFL